MSDHGPYSDCPLLTVKNNSGLSNELRPPLVDCFIANQHTHNSQGGSTNKKCRVPLVSHLRPGKLKARPAP
jgi:hypothetical protein